MQILYYIYQQKQINASLEQAWLRQLPDGKAEAIRRIQVESKRHQSLIGLQLLDFGLRRKLKRDDFSLKQVQFPKHGKPFWQAGIDFNISHSANLIVCAIAANQRVGIDVEKDRDIKPGVFERYTSERERHANPCPLEIWTQKEAVVKAADSGGITTIHKVEIVDNTSHFANTLWHLKRIEILPDYIVQLASERPAEHIPLIPITIHDLVTTKETDTE